VADRRQRRRNYRLTGHGPEHDRQLKRHRTIVERHESDRHAVRRRCGEGRRRDQSGERKAAGERRKRHAQPSNSVPP